MPHLFWMRCIFRLNASILGFGRANPWKIVGSIRNPFVICRLTLIDVSSLYPIDWNVHILNSCKRFISAPVSYSISLNYRAPIKDLFICSWSPASKNNCTFPSFTNPDRAPTMSMMNDFWAPAPPAGMIMQRGFPAILRAFLQANASGMPSAKSCGIQCLDAEIKDGGHWESSTVRIFWIPKQYYSSIRHPPFSSAQFSLYLFWDKTSHVILF